MFFLPLDPNSETEMSTEETISVVPLPSAQCIMINFPYCNQLNYTLTSYPNLLGHKDNAHLSKDAISLRLVQKHLFAFRITKPYKSQILQHHARE